MIHHRVGLIHVICLLSPSAFCFKMVSGTEYIGLCNSIPANNLKVTVWSQTPDCSDKEYSSYFDLPLSFNKALIHQMEQRSASPTVSKRSHSYGMLWFPGIYYQSSFILFIELYNCTQSGSYSPLKSNIKSSKMKTLQDINVQGKLLNHGTAAIENLLYSKYTFTLEGIIFNHPAYYSVHCHSSTFGYFVHSTLVCCLGLNDNNATCMLKLHSHS